MLNFTRLFKFTVGISYLYLVFLICRLPYFISLPAFKITEINGPKVTPKIFSLFFTNSICYILIYLWVLLFTAAEYMRHIRHAVMNILRNTGIAHRTKHWHWPEILWHGLMSLLLSSSLWIHRRPTLLTRATIVFELCNAVLQKTCLIML